jgi:antitoxin HigA-1
MVYPAKRSKNRCPTHPGALLRDDIIPATGRTKAEIAGLLGISRQHLYDILQERKPVSPATAVRLGKLFGDGAGIWPGCKLPTIPGMPSAQKMSVTSRQSRRRRLEKKSSRDCQPISLQFPECRPSTVPRPAKPCYPAGLQIRTEK